MLGVVLSLVGVFLSLHAWCGLVPDLLFAGSSGRLTTERAAVTRSPALPSLSSITMRFFGYVYLAKAVAAVRAAFLTSVFNPVL